MTTLYISRYWPTSNCKRCVSPKNGRIWRQWNIQHDYPTWIFCHVL